jgi:hypothetical protein
MKTIFAVDRIGKGMTIFIMGQVGKGQAMTLRNYLKKFPDSSRENVRNRVTSLIEAMHLKGVLHGNLHSQNILVTADALGRLTGMWVIDFGRSRGLPLGMTERELFPSLNRGLNFWTSSVFNNGVGLNVQVREGSRPNVHMAAVHYGRRYLPERENAIRKRRLEIYKEMENYKTPTKVASVRKTQSARRASPVKSVAPSVRKTQSARRASPVKSAAPSAKRRRKI